MIIFDEFSLLVDWYEQNSEGQAERAYHSGPEYGITIETIDNPGWHVLLEGVSDKEAISLVRHVDDDDWLHIQASSQSFEAYGDSHKIKEILVHAARWLGLVS